MQSENLFLSILKIIFNFKFNIRILHLRKEREFMIYFFDDLFFKFFSYLVRRKKKSISLKSFR